MVACSREVNIIGSDEPTANIEVNEAPTERRMCSRLLTLPDWHEIAQKHHNGKIG
jgi:hypothetical protein